MVFHFERDKSDSQWYTPIYLVNNEKDVVVLLLAWKASSSCNFPSTVSAAESRKSLCRIYQFKRRWKSCALLIKQILEGYHCESDMQLYKWSSNRKQSCKNNSPFTISTSLISFSSFVNSFSCSLKSISFDCITFTSSSFVLIPWASRCSICSPEKIICLFSLF